MQEKSKLLSEKLPFPTEIRLTISTTEQPMISKLCGPLAIASG